MPEITYKEWIKKFNNEKSPIGDLSRDINIDEKFPEYNNKLYILEYLQNNSACYGAIDAFTKSWYLFSLEFIKKWNPKTGTVCELQELYINAYTKTRKLCQRKKTPENEALLKKIGKYRKHIPNTGVADLNRRLYREGNILHANRIIASDYKGYCLLHRGIEEDGRPNNVLYRIYTFEEVKRRLDNRKKSVD